MAKAQVKLSLRQNRTFSESLKKKIVADIEKGKVNISAVAREYKVHPSSIYNWLNKFSRHLQSSSTLVMQMDSEQYRSKELEKRILELEAALGRKQLENDYLNKLIELADQDLGMDIKKNIGLQLSIGSGETKGKKGSV
jgi:transposase-like protein